MFNISIEDLSDELKKECDLDLKDILFYAEAFLVLCSSPNQLAQTIKIIARWSEENKMLLNKKKSRIFTFTKRTKSVPDIGKKVEGVPVLTQYKYLGTILTNKLSMIEHMKFILDKSNFIYFKLFPYLKQPWFFHCLMYVLFYLHLNSVLDTNHHFKHCGGGHLNSF